MSLLMISCDLSQLLHDQTSATLLGTGALLLLSRSSRTTTRTGPTHGRWTGRTGHGPVDLDAGMEEPSIHAAEGTVDPGQVETLGEVLSDAAKRACLPRERQGRLSWPGASWR